MRRNHLAGTAELAWVLPDIQPGDVISGISGRELNFAAISRSTETKPQVEKVTITFADRWNTKIKFGAG